LLRKRNKENQSNKCKKKKQTRSETKSASSSLNETSDELRRLKFGFDERLESPVVLSTGSNVGTEFQLHNWDLRYFSGRGGGRGGGGRRVSVVLDEDIFSGG
jgi:hypothetical protein